MFGNSAILAGWMLVQIKTLRNRLPNFRQLMVLQTLSLGFVCVAFVDGSSSLLMIIRTSVVYILYIYRLFLLNLDCPSRLLVLPSHPK